MERSREWVLDQLLIAMAQEDPLESLVRRAARVCNGSALVINEHGEIVRSVGAAPGQLVSRWVLDPRTGRKSLADREVVGDGGSGIAGTVGKWQVHAHRVSIRRRTYAIVVAVLPGNPRSEMPALVLDCVAKLLRSFESLETFAITTRREESAQVLKELIVGVSPGREGSMWNRLAEFGFAAYQPLRIARASIVTGAGDAPGPSAPQAIPDGVHLVVETGRSRLRTEYTVLVPADTAMERFIVDVGSAEIGVSEPFVVLSRIPELLRSADVARSIAAADGSGIRIVRVDELKPHHGRRPDSTPSTTTR